MAAPPLPSRSRRSPAWRTRTAARGSGKILIVHEDTRSGGLAGEITATICEDAFEFLDAPIMRVTGPDAPAMPFSAPLEAAFLPNVDRVAEAMRQLARY